MRNLIFKMRIDKWASAVRMVKSRTLAGDLCHSGKLKLNGEKVKSSKIIQIGDLVEVDFKTFIKKYEVVDFLEKRSSAEIAQKYFKDLTEKTEFEKKFNFKEEFGEIQKAKFSKGRPTKKDRRELEKLQDFGF